MRALFLKMGVVAGLLLGGFVGHAQAADSASLKLSIIHASKKAGPADPALRRIAKRLKRSFSGHKTFKEEAKHKFDLRLKKTRQIKLPNGKTASFTYLGKVNKTDQFKVSIPRSKVNMKVSVRKNGLFFVRLPFKYKGGNMIMALFLR